MASRATEQKRTYGRWGSLIGALLVGALLGWMGRDLAGWVSEPPPARIAVAASTGAAPGTDPATDTADGLRRALQFWSTTAFAWASRAQDLEALLEDLPNETTDPRASLQHAIDESSDRELARIVAAITRIDEDELRDFDDLRPFASRLVEVALDGLQGPSSEPPPDQRVQFASSTRDFDPDTSAEHEFPADQGRIFAMIDLAGYDGDRVMVKWLNKDSKRIHSLQSMRYDKSRPLWSYVSRDGDWEPGKYQVDVYSQSAQMKLLSRGEYTILESRRLGDS